MLESSRTTTHVVPLFVILLLLLTNDLNYHCGQVSNANNCSPNARITSAQGATINNKQDEVILLPNNDHYHHQQQQQLQNFTTTISLVPLQTPSSAIDETANGRVPGSEPISATRNDQVQTVSRLPYVSLPATALASLSSSVAIKEASNSENKSRHSSVSVGTMQGQEGDRNAFKTRTLFTFKTTASEREHEDINWNSEDKAFNFNHSAQEKVSSYIEMDHQRSAPKNNHDVGQMQHVKRAVALQDLNLDCEFQGGRKPTIFGLRCDSAEVTESGEIVIRAFTPTRIYLIGRNLYSNLTIALTEQDGAPQDDCTHANRIKSLKLYNFSLNIAEIVLELAPPEKSVPYYFCIREDTQDSRWYHQGSEAWLKIQVEQDFMPLWAKICLIAILLSASGLFSGLNLGLMALDKNDLQVIMKCGSEDEKRYATIIEPARRRGNYLLCSILFSNTLVNSTISVFLEDLSDGLVAIITSTVLIVLFGEILPQAFCSRHGLAVGAKTIWLTNFCMFITFPLSYPVSYCLDWALGEEIGHAYDRERLMEFIRITKDANNLEADEVNIIFGALKIKRVQISEVMTRIEDVYMLDENAVLDFDTIQAIVGKGYSRIPVHESGNKRNIVAVLFAKDLALVDPDDRTPVQTMINFYDHPRMFVFEDTTLDKALNEFKTGKSHMAIVQRVIDDGDRDPYYEVTGIVTLEDVIEEILEMEINDETDTLTDNRRKRRRKDAQVRKDFSQFTNLGTGDSSFNVVTPQLCLAAYQYLATTVEPFTPKYLSDSIMRRLLSQKIFYKVRLDDENAVKRLYTAGEPADYFIMILEGRVHVTCGKENLFFDGGPFSFFGKAALSQLDQNEPANVTAGISNSFAPSTPGAQTSLNLTNASGAVIRRDSTRPVLSRRESLAKIVTSQLSLANKKVADLEQNQIASANELSPTSSATAPETVELLERGSYYFKPDYTVDVIANTSYLKITRNDYITALRATRIEREGAAILGEDINQESVMILDSSHIQEPNHDK